MKVLRQFSVLLHRFSLGLARIELFICQILIVAFAGLLLVNVCRRYVFSAPIYFAEELAIYILIWMAFLAIAATIAHRRMIALTFLSDMAPPAIRRVIDIAVDLTVLVMCVVLALVSWRWLNSFAVVYEQALTLGIAKKPFYAIMPIFFVLAAFHTIANLARDLTRPADARNDAPDVSEIAR